MHEPQWQENYGMGNETIMFTCRICGKHISGNRKRYNEGRWFPSLAPH